MLRATNTGVTAVINERGYVEESAPEFTMAVVTREVRGYGGATPFARWGNYGALALSAALVGLALIAGTRRAR
jgi:apolipoprotein N-acyltransferase